MKNIILPPLHGSETVNKLTTDRHISLVGAGGAGKSRFMDEMMRDAGDRAWSVSVVDDSRPDMPMAFREGLSASLLAEASSADGGGETPLFRRVRTEWENLFPGNRIVVSPPDSLLFQTPAGDDLIDLSRLSRGERAGLYFIFAVLAAPRGAVIFVDSPTLFLHPTVVGPLWTRLERLRPDCRFVYDTNDPSFIGSRIRNIVIWVKAFHSEDETWEYQLLPTDEAGPVYVDLIGSRRPVLFIEGDVAHSIDARLYSLVFPDYTVRPLGSCDKVIETTRTFRYLKQYHPLDTIGIIDRDRRSESEVEYLRRRSVMVAEVAEVENIFLSEPVLRIMASATGLDPERTVRNVKEIVFDLFERMFDDQALQHTRHRMKRDVERKIDARFTCITALELHIKGLIHTLHPREVYNELTSQFAAMLRRRDYAGVLKVFNYKPMLTATAIPKIMGYGSADEYVTSVLRTLKSDPVNGPALREAILALFPPASEVEPTQEKPRAPKVKPVTHKKADRRAKSEPRANSKRYKTSKKRRR